MSLLKSLRHSAADFKRGYENLKVVKNLGGHCENCAYSHTSFLHSVLCAFKKNKVVNKLAVCQHFKEKHEITKDK